MIENKHSVLILPHLRLIHLLYILHSPSLCSDTPKYSNISFLVIMRCKFFKVKIENHFLMEFLYTSNNTYMIQTFGIPLHPSPHAPSLVLWRPGHSRTSSPLVSSSEELLPSITRIQGEEIQDTKLSHYCRILFIWLPAALHIVLFILFICFLEFILVYLLVLDNHICTYLCRRSMSRT